MHSSLTIVCPSKTAVLCAVGGDRDDGSASRAGAGIGGEVDISSKKRGEGHTARSNAYELHVQTVFFIEPEFLGDPKRGPVSGERT